MQPSLQHRRALERLHECNPTPPPLVITGTDSSTPYPVSPYIHTYGRKTGNLGSRAPVARPQHHLTLRRGRAGSLPDLARLAVLPSRVPGDPPTSNWLSQWHCPCARETRPSSTAPSRLL
ncbi:hypothetical protein IF2G_03617 [Cordyceps javanica]|nr:hypothetical protein IF2G_03617 [Cordyceps javanica]